MIPFCRGLVKNGKIAQISANGFWEIFPRGLSGARMKKAFTLVEMLVVIGIIAVLAALLLPAVMSAVNAAKRAAIAMEVNQLADAIEAYRKDKGDYPPSFRDAAALERHLRKCYPKMAPAEWGVFFSMTNGVVNRDANGVPIWKTTSPAGSPLIDEGEALVFWLGSTFVDARYPFTANGNNNADRKSYYDFDRRRLVNDDNDAYPSYRSNHAKETCYLYCDARFYDELADFANTNYGFAFAETSTTPEAVCRPYWSDEVNPKAPTGATLDRDKLLPVNPTSFQILCAGLDGNFGYLETDADVKRFVSGTRYSEEDGDNMTSFSAGKRLLDEIP
jgi:prepilin-type N-terminal cleavage/methylation domain-containing protein